MKTSTRLLPLLALLIIMACNNEDEPRLQRFDASFQILFPEDFLEENASEVAFSLTNLSSGQVIEETSGANGEVNIENIVPGLYRLQATRVLSEEEAAVIVGSPININLNYVDNNLLLNPTIAASPVQIRLEGSIAGNLVISQVYYAGSATPEGSNYFFDQFFEIYNNTSEPIILDGLILSNVHGPSGQINPNTIPTPFAEDQSNVYVTTAWRIPGNGNTNVLAPFSAITIAQQGINHRASEANPNSPVDLSQADFELFVVGSERDVDAPNVTNMEMLYHPFNSTFSLVPVFGPGTIIWRTEDFDALEQVPVPGANPDSPPVVKVPNNLVIDAVEALRSESDGSFKRIPVSLDAGFSFVNDIYSAESIIRKTRTVDGNMIYEDTNNSTNDFVINPDPSPADR
ncbi:DUF4876 domain-containing protein [Arthrospiribacter ruber]|uniref:DUF4876 domain-containing protein n=1 Tax=Arthrospiribacter ruber TaxID=2487934 RepID=A0A951IS05_9BACT|nr:DUF4876 domain-containing protein [Arthrospiribacter ruber]MBW3466820.1 DUF4876 domain-containing protein [Arthrospiribacter ruber]MBW3469612.1 DUF4876 domain-containing protein [Arthrospiribacter ruber]MBW3470313.1 DUF4876 domain-containing protein [Arthrospiribacter ruber]